MPKASRRDAEHERSRDGRAAAPRRPLRAGGLGAARRGRGPRPSSSPPSRGRCTSPSTATIWRTAWRHLAGSAGLSVSSVARAWLFEGRRRGAPRV